MKRASYRHGVEIIALNEEPEERDPAVVAGMVSVGLLATLFGVTTERVAGDIVRYRIEAAKGQEAPKGSIWK